MESDPKDPSKEDEKKALTAASMTLRETLQADSASHNTVLDSTWDDEIATKSPDAPYLPQFESLMPQNRRLMKELILNAEETKETAASLDEIKAYGSALQPLCPILEGHRSRLPPGPPESKIRHVKIISNNLAHLLETDPSITAIALDSSYENILGFFEGPPSSPYAGGIFSVLMTLPAEFPFQPPKCRFMTKMYHPNIDLNGEFCLDILEREWSPGIGLGGLLISILSLLTDPAVDDPLIPEIAVTYLVDRKQFDEDVELYTKKYATLKNALLLLPESSRPGLSVAKESDQDVEDLAGKLRGATLGA